MQKRVTKIEKFTTSHSYEEITDMETDFLLQLYDAVVKLLMNGDKVSLPNISRIVKVSPSELMDYLPEITEIERQLNVSANE
jgi:hypothetical protein